MKRISLLIVDDHESVRAGFRALLGQESDIEILGEAGDGQQAVVMAAKRNPDVILMDVVMPGMNGRDATKRILRENPAAKILVLSSYGDDESVLEMMNAGASGFLTKHTVSRELLTAIREVKMGRPFFSSALPKKPRCSEGKCSKRWSFVQHCPLTARELEVLRLVAEGLSNRRAAAELNISIKTIEKHRQSVMNKLSIHETAGLTRYAISRGLVGRVPALAASK